MLMTMAMLMMEKQRPRTRAELLSELAYQACLEADFGYGPYRTYYACRAAAQCFAQPPRSRPSGPLPSQWHPPQRSAPCTP